MFLTDIQINPTLIFVLVVALILSFVILFDKINRLKNESLQKDFVREKMTMEKDSIIETMKKEAALTAFNLAKEQLEKWKDEELDSYKKVIDEISLETAMGSLEKWKIEYERTIRKDAANRSVRVVMGRVTENLVPFTETFKYNPRDTRFIGNPIDLIVFDGLEENQEKIFIYFIEVKTGTSTLSAKQKKIRDAIKEGRVDWEIISLKDFGDSVNEELQNLI